jgi:aldehyde:ferredoxin oxidoreductase
MSVGYAGKILRLDLTNKTSSVIDTEPYEEWGGSFGMACALFWDECEDFKIDGLDPRNVLVVAANPLTGTIATGAGSKIDIVGVSPYSYPDPWFTRSGLGNKFGPMMKKAGWDAIVIKGESDTPVWVNIINDKVVFEDAATLWGQDARYTQEEIWRRVTGKNSFGEWLELEDGTQTTEGPVCLTIGQAGENLSRIAAVMHGSSGGACQGGFGAVFGKKKLKAISCLGTGSITIADIDAMIKARNLCLKTGLPPAPQLNSYDPSSWTQTLGRQTACVGCITACKTRRQDGYRNDGQCMSQLYAIGKNGAPGVQSSSDFVGRYGMNIFETYYTQQSYVKFLYDEGVIGPGKEIDTYPLNMNDYGTVQYAEAHARALATRTGIGEYLAEGTARLAEAVGRYEQDLAAGILQKSQYGYEWHHSLPEAMFSYCSMFDSRDANIHAFQNIWSLWTHTKLSAEDSVKLISSKTVPYTDDPYMFDWSFENEDTGIYSDHRVKLVSWVMAYGHYFTHSMGFCDWLYPRFNNSLIEGENGISPEIEEAYVNAACGKNQSFEEMLEVGVKIGNLVRAIYVLQGRNRENETLGPQMFTINGSGAGQIYGSGGPCRMPVLKDGEWVYDFQPDAFFDKDKFEDFKTRYYKFEGWDSENGYPTRETLERYGLSYIADKLESEGKLGS